MRPPRDRACAGEPLTPDRARAAPDPRAARGALARLGCARLRGRPVSRAQRGPRRSLQDGHDSRAGSAADGPRDVPARVAGAPPLRHILVPWAVPGGVALQRTEQREGGSRGHDSRSGLAWPVPARDQFGKRCEPAGYLVLLTINALTPSARPRLEARRRAGVTCAC
jgi:hypothetical protein